MSIKRVAVAGAGRIGLPIALELVASGFDVTVLTRDAARSKHDLKTVQVDYDSDTSLRNALDGHDAVVSAVAMSAISNQPRLIDAAIAAGVKLFIPAEYTVNTRDPGARAQPMMASVLAIQEYLVTKQDQIDWTVINPGALTEFSLDIPFIIDFDARNATLWDGGDGSVSISTIPTLAQAVAAALKHPDRIRNKILKIHNGAFSQNQTLEIARRYTHEPWTTNTADAAAVYKQCMNQLTSGEGDPLMSIFPAYCACAFGHTAADNFDAALKDPDNDWLGVPLWKGDEEFAEWVQKRIEQGPWASRSGTADAESLDAVASDIASQHAQRI